MFEKKEDNKYARKEDNLSVFRAPKGSSKVIIGDGVTMKGEITNAHEVQIDGVADLIVKTENLTVGSNGNLKGPLNGTIKNGRCEQNFKRSLKEPWMQP